MSRNTNNLRPDGHGWRARLGLLTHDDSAISESELWTMAPDGVSLHTSRVFFADLATFANPPGPENATELLARLPTGDRGNRRIGRRPAPMTTDSISKCHADEDAHVHPARPPPHCCGGKMVLASMNAARSDSSMRNSSAIRSAESCSVRISQRTVRALTRSRAATSLVVRYSRSPSGFTVCVRLLSPAQVADRVAEDLL